MAPGELPPSGVINFALWLEDRYGLSVALEPTLVGVDGACLAQGDSRFMLLNSSTAGVRRRWTMAHELGHLLLADEDELTIDEDIWERSPMETRANAFAAGFLVPASDLREQWRTGDKSVQHVVSLLERYDVSVEALAYRLHNTNCVDAVGRDAVLNERFELNARRMGSDSSRSAVKSPGPLLQRATMGYLEGLLGIRPLADLMNLSPDDLIQQFEAEEGDAAGLDRNVAAGS